MKHKHPPVDRKFAIYESTLLRGLMAHMQALAREMAGNYFEIMHHELSTIESLEAVLDGAKASGLKRTYTEMVQDLIILFPGEVHPVSFGELSRSGSFDRAPLGGRDPYRISLKKLKKLADKRRSQGHPEFKLLRDVVLKKRPHQKILFDPGQKLRSMRP